MSYESPSMPPLSPSDYWRGLGVWNLYFICKLALFWQEVINFHPLANLVFAAFLVFPLPPQWLHRLRHVIAIPAGVALFYYDTWLPPFERLLAQSSQVSAMSPAYLLDLAGRVIDWQWVGAFFVLAVGYAFIAPWVRVTVPVVAGLIWLGVSPLLPLNEAALPGAAVAQPATASPGSAAQTQASTPVPVSIQKVTDEVLTQQLDAFHASEQQRQTSFSARPAGASPFDILIINICSLAWDDMEMIGLTEHPLFDYLDVIFDNFNTATSYSGPAGIRLLQASCGQNSHQAIYEEVPAQCLLFENLAELGFAPELVLNHDGQFDSYLEELRQEGGLDVPMLSQQSQQPVMAAFDDSPIYGDYDMLNAWERQNTDEPSAVFYNSVTLHDGNRFIGESDFADYSVLLRQMFDDLLAFLQQLEDEGRRVAVFIVPEHGAALRGDKMQFSGMREIPSPLITHVPVGMKLTGVQQPRQGEPRHIAAPVSYLAVSELISRLVARDVFAGSEIDWPGLLGDLPQTRSVSENEAVVMMPFQGEPYVRLQGEGWMPYPQ